MDIKSQLYAVQIFEYAFHLLEDKANEGVRSIDARTTVGEIVKGLSNPVNEEAMAKILQEIPHIREDENIMVYQYIPAVVLISFCSELALKVLIKQTRSADERGHKLSGLMKKLSPDLRESIQKEVTREMNITDSKFADLLNKNDDGFVNWRYFYEGDRNFNLDFLKSLFSKVKSKISWI